MDYPSPQASNSTVVEHRSEGSSSSSARAAQNGDQIADAQSLSQESSNESSDPLHDEHADSDDEAWVMEHLLRGLLPMQSSMNPNGAKKGTDAGDNDAHEVGVDSHGVGNSTSESFTSPHEERISCPCCFTIVSLQAQPHDKFEGQFRALFVSNCVVLRTSRVTTQYFPLPQHSGDHQRRGNSDRANTSTVDVACAQCGTLVGVLDESETYHFCNVIY